MTDSWKVGGVQFPLPTSTANTLLHDADPALFYALDFCASMITTYAGARLLAEAAAAGGQLASAIASPVATRIHYDPVKYLTEAQYILPLLAIFRQSGVNRYYTVAKWQEDTTWTAVFSLPPLTAGQSQRMMPILHAIPLLLANRIENGFDPTYTPPGSTLGGKVWALAGVKSIKHTETSYGGFEGTGNLFFPAVSMTFHVEELNSPPSGTPLLGIDNYQGIRAPDGSTVASVSDSTTNKIVPP